MQPHVSQRQLSVGLADFERVSAFTPGLPNYLLAATLATVERYEDAATALRYAMRENPKLALDAQHESDDRTTPLARLLHHAPHLRDEIAAHLRREGLL